MSDDLESIIRAIRQESNGQTPEEETFELDSKPFDPIKKIASVLSRTSVVSLSRYHDDESVERILGYTSYRGEEATEALRAIYGEPVFSLMEYFGSGLMKYNRSGSILINILTKSHNAEEALEKIALMRIKHTCLDHPKAKHKPKARNENYSRTHRRPRRLNSELKEWVDKESRLAELPLEELAHDIAMYTYEKIAVRLYHEKFGIPSGAIKLPASYLRKRDEDYQQPAQGLVPLDPKAMMAANSLYPYLHGLEGRLKRVKSVFDLILLVGIGVYQNRINDPSLAKNIQDELNGNKDLQRVFYGAILNYQLAMLEGKLK